MARHGRCPSISASSIAVMPWRDVRSVDDHALTARLFLICEAQMVLSNTRGSAGKHHRGKASRRTQGAHVSYAPWYADALFVLRSLVR